MNDFIDQNSTHGLFFFIETIVDEKEMEKSTGYNLNDEELENFDIEENSVNMEFNLKQKLIPLILKDKFMIKFGDQSTCKESEIDVWLKEHEEI